MRLLLAALLALPAVAEPVALTDWHVIGPFEAGSREALVHHLAESDGRIPEAPDLARSWPSALADGGRVAWRPIAGDDGVVRLALDGVDWEARRGELGTAALLNVAYLHATFTLQAPGLLLLEASRCTVRIGGELHAGDPYGAGIAKSVVRGRAGVNHVLVASPGLGAEREISVRLTPVTEEMGDVLLVTEDVLLPDAIAGEAGEGWARVSVLNLTDRWLTADVGLLAGAVGFPATAPLAPRAAMAVPVPVGWRTPAPAEVELLPSGSRVPLRVRARSESRVETFVAFDGSVQPYGVVPATSPDASGLVLSLHGAGVTAAGQAAAYEPLRWATIVAPQGRRPFGFDWHDWSERDALEVLSLAASRFGADPSRLVLTGQSMGGHGAWALGCHRPDLFAHLTTSAAWIGHDSVVPFTLRRSTHEAPAEMQSLLMQALAPGRVGGLLDNLHDLPVRVFHGGSDDNISPWHARWLVGALQRRGFDATLCEAPGKGHWSDLDVPLDRPEGCADIAALRAEWERARRDARPRRVVIVTTDPDVGGKRSWLRLVSQELVARESRMDAVVGDDGMVRVTTRNARSVEIDPGEATRIEIDGVPIPSSSRTTLTKRGERWVRSRTAATRPQPGGVAKALDRPFLVVAGTLSRPEASLHAARTIAHAWWVRAGGLARIVRDVDLTDVQRASHALVIVGGPEVNAEAARLRRSLLVTVDATGARIDGRLVRGEHLATVHWQLDAATGNPLLVLQSADALADDLLPELHPIAPGAGLPDWVVADPSVRHRGWGGFRAAGFWSPEWRLDPVSAVSF